MPISSSRSSNFYRKTLSAGIDSSIAGLTANNSTKLIFSTMTPNGTCCNGDSSTDPVNPVFIRSTTCWAKNIDTSPISPWNNGGGYPAPEHAGGFGGTGTLISPRHIVYCNHFQIKVGKKLIFVDMNNNCYIRTLSNSLQVGSTDIQIGLLDSDLPSSVSFCKVASFDLTSITDTNNRVAALYLDQERKALVGDYFNSDSAGSLNISTNSQRANFYELPIGGDSACPINFVYNNKIILLFLFTSTFDGESIPYNIAAINSVMTTLGGGYTLSLFNKKDIVSEQKNISIKKQNLGGGKISLNLYYPDDSDARNYILAVEAVEGPLEVGVKKVINNFIVGCKSDGIWTAIKASCLLAGPKTLNGALVPLVGTAPTNFNFITADYDRKTGLLGDGSTKYLSSNRENNADPQNSKHLSVYCTSGQTRDATRYLIGSIAGVGGSFIATTTNTLAARINYGTVPTNISTTALLTNLIGVTRPDSAGTNAILEGSIIPTSNISTAPFAGNTTIFTRADLSFYSNARIAFYSIGENIDLQKLDNRVRDYIHSFS
jgi:hypothetical protein